MADWVTILGAFVTLLGFLVLFCFIRRLGLLEIDAALMGNDFQRPTMEPQPMVEVKNPFKITVSSSDTSGCIELILSSSQDCYIHGYWKVRKEIFDQELAQSQRDADTSVETEKVSEGNNFPSLQTIFRNTDSYERKFSSEFTEACEGKKVAYNVEDIAKKSCQEITPDHTVHDLVITMELTKDDKDKMDSPCGIVAMLVGIDLKRQQQNFKPYAVQQYIQSLNGKLFKVKKLFLEESGNPVSEQEPDESLCIVCQMMPISRALIPCGHACLCVLCFDKMNACPMCRNIITSSFILREEPNINNGDDRQFSEILKLMNPIEIIRGIYNAS